MTGHKKYRKSIWGLRGSRGPFQLRGSENLSLELDFLELVILGSQLFDFLKMCVDWRESGVAEEGYEFGTRLDSLGCSAINLSAFDKQSFISLHHFLGSRTWQALMLSVADTFFLFMRLCLCVFMLAPARQWLGDSSFCRDKHWRRHMNWNTS